MSTKKTITLGGDLSGNRPPTEFRLFKAGINDTTKGRFLFDAKAAAAVMAKARAYGVDYMIDLEHCSLDTGSKNFDPDARGWFRLDVIRGELWAVNVRWTADGARRLSDKTQRYISPAFLVDDENRVTEILNVALVAMPATHNTPALVAASRGTTMQTKTPIIRLAADGSDAGKLAAIEAGGAKIQEAIAALASAKTDQAAAAAVFDACLELESALSALYGVGGGASAEPTAPQEVATPLGRMTLTVNQLKEAKRAGITPERLAEQLARNPRYAAQIRR